MSEFRKLFVVIDPETAIEPVSERIQTALRDVLRASQMIDVWAVAVHDEFVATVREADCMVGWRD